MWRSRSGDSGKPGLSSSNAVPEGLPFFSSATHIAWAHPPQPASNGGNAGKAGRGGKGGKAGDIEVVDQENEFSKLGDSPFTVTRPSPAPARPYNVRADPGGEGANGDLDAQPGAPGAPGDPGKDVCLQRDLAIFHTRSPIQDHFDENYCPFPRDTVYSPVYSRDPTPENRLQMQTWFVTDNPVRIIKPILPFVAVFGHPSELQQDAAYTRQESHQVASMAKQFANEQRLNQFCAAQARCPLWARWQTQFEKVIQREGDRAKEMEARARVAEADLKVVQDDQGQVQTEVNDATQTFQQLEARVTSLEGAKANIDSLSNITLVKNLRVLERLQELRGATRELFTEVQILAIGRNLKTAASREFGTRAENLKRALQIRQMKREDEKKRVEDEKATLEMDKALKLEELSRIPARFRLASTE